MSKGSPAQRAEAAEQAVVRRHLRRLWGLPGTALGVVGWPPAAAERSFARWHYWWQAHLLDALLDAEQRRPDPARRRRIAALARGVRTRNLRGWTNDYFDDMAWLALALERAGRHQVVRRAAAVRVLTAELRGAWTDRPAGIPWRRGDEVRNVPANGPAAILLARTGDLAGAARIAGWIDRTLVDPATGLVLDGVLPDGTLDRRVFSYCQGVVLGAETELSRRTGRPEHRARVDRLVAAVAGQLSPGGVLRGQGGGDGGLFAGILARYLALVARSFPGTEPGRTAAVLVRDSAAAAWTNRRSSGGGPLFGPDWSVPTASPRPGRPERDLSVQLSGWLLLEAAATLG